MDRLVSVLDRIFIALVIKPVSKKALDSLAETLPGLELGNKFERDGFVEDAWGNSSPNLEMAMDGLLKKWVFQLQKNISVEQLKEGVRREFKEIQKELRGVKAYYEAFTDNKNRKSWEDFHESTGAFKIELDDLYLWITEPTCATRDNLLDAIISICDNKIPLFGEWHRTIIATLTQGYLLRIAFHYHSTFSQEPYISGSDSTSPPGSRELSDKIKKEIMDMEERIIQVDKLITKRHQELKVKFLERKCEDQKCKAGCEGKNGRKCCELGCKLHKLLKEKKEANNFELAQLIAGTLDKDYSYFMWSVMVFKDYNQAEFQLNLDYSSEVLVQRFGSKKLGKTKERTTESSILSKGAGVYGCFLCYRIRKSRIAGENSEKAVLVLWTDREKIQTNGVARKCNTLLQKWKNDEAFRLEFQTSGAGNVHFAAGTLRKKRLKEIFAVGLHEPYEDEMGVKFAEIKGGDGNGQATTETYEVPLRFGEGNSWVLIWPETSAQDFELSSGELENITALPGQKYSVKKGFGRMVNKELTVAIKEIPLALGESKKDELKRQIIALNCMGVSLKELDHPHLVRYLDFQSPPPRDKFTHQKYQMIMEYCEGGSLSDRVKKEGTTLDQKTEWGRGVLNGLVYLHKRNLSHRSIQGDHLLFKLPEDQIKIISVMKINDVLKPAMQSYNLQAPISSFEPFQPPETELKTGSKTDIWSFGCVLIQMLTSNPPPPEIRKSKTDKEIEKIIGKILPGDPLAEWRDVIKKCLKMDYDARPTASEVLLSKFFMMARTSSC